MTKCCACAGGAPTYHCRCICHRQEDCEYWEVMAYVWIYDAADDAARAAQWARFKLAYPEFAHERCEDFWERIQHTRWFHKHHHKHHRHHPYDHDDHNGQDDQD